ncbi:arachidonate 5-lipoxygenase-like [Takifugu rubripes]|uniref:arachidonate 5-lipoxygenase-like n=1 Tax=Takifugu rubripes TaxID=31033 RepID=UPI001145F4AB|nr:arachidonate 5-lipoxygenase-like [Takifugu rubripes]XP_029691624.1 arachidonate 5-lipoxygenase-like [Takifugu rubripes]XP_029691625.1 arachidonate 5-lipoxygenase-like [Takifugu rubripes]
MPSYTVTTATGSNTFDGTDNSVYITLVGTLQCSRRTLLDKPLHNDFARMSVDTYVIDIKEDLGEIIMVKLQKKKFLVFDDWYCRSITVKTPSGQSVEFPCFRWLVDDKEVVLRDGQAILPQDDKSAPLMEHRDKELELRRKTYRWSEWQPGFPMSIDAVRYKDLPQDIQFDTRKEVDFDVNFTAAILSLNLTKFKNMFQSRWEDFADFERILQKMKSTVSEYVRKHWKEDLMFGYQFLNGCNPVVIEKCTKLPDKLPVTNEMVSVCLERGLTLEEELQAGNIYIADYEFMDGIKPNDTDPLTQQYLAAPICLLYRDLQKEIIPIAIQLNQIPGEDNPIFLPTDAEYDWLLAKMWVRSTDFQHHQTVTHLLKTHLISEMFAIALFRQLPAVHPMYKLLIPHIRFTIGINTKAREKLICKGGLFDKANSTGGGGHVQLVQKAMKTLTFGSLCFPDSIKARGMDSKEELPAYFYRDDGLKVWEAIKSYICEVVCIYYKDDEAVQHDKEIQAFVQDVRDFGMQNFDQCEFPRCLKTREELTTYLTVVIFTASAQHAAVNFGQFDWYSWVPNTPSTMRRPPPKQKGLADMTLIMETLPDCGRSAWHLGAVWSLSQYQENELYLGTFPDDHFTEQPVKAAMDKFRKQLADITFSIKKRNEGKDLPYYYMSPDKIPNSVAI